MAGYFVLGTLAAMGCLSILWAAAGWLLPRERGWALVCLGEPEEPVLWRYRWLKSLGLLHCPLIVAAGTEDTEIPGWEALASRLEQGRFGEHGTGNGDPPGRGQRRGVSEL